MRVVVVGATGNVGTSLLYALSGDPEISSVLGVARRVPDLDLPKVTWTAAHIARDDLAPVFRGADAVVHLAWLIQPSRDEWVLYATNVTGSRRVFDGVARAGVPALVYASSVGAYSPGPKDRPVDESWPTEGIRSSFYSRHKAEVERMLDAFESEHPQVRVVRLRPGLIFKGEAGSGVRRLFLGPFVPNALLRKPLIPVVPDVPGLVFQAVHSLDAGQAYHLAVTRDVRGAFNIAADPILDPDELSRALSARKLRLSPGFVRTAAAVAWRLRLSPTPPGWVDMALQAPVMATDRARTELGWRPGHTSVDALLELLDGISRGAGTATPPLQPGTVRGRLREIVTGVGGRDEAERPGPP
jgi:nucleoside-diphosphate-sugar epimerase